METMGFVFGVMLGIACASFLTAVLVRISNNIGANAGEFEDFSQSEIHYFKKEDGVSANILDKEK